MKIKTKSMKKLFTFVLVATMILTNMSGVMANNKVTGKDILEYTMIDKKFEMKSDTRIDIDVNSIEEIINLAFGMEETETTPIDKREILTLGIKTLGKSDGRANTDQKITFMAKANKNLANSMVMTVQEDGSYKKGPVESALFEDGISINLDASQRPEGIYLNGEDFVKDINAKLDAAATKVTGKEEKMQLEQLRSEINKSAQDLLKGKKYAFISNKYTGTVTLDVEKTMEQAINLMKAYENYTILGAKRTDLGIVIEYNSIEEIIAEIINLINYTNKNREEVVPKLAEYIKSTSPDADLTVEQITKEINQSLDEIKNPEAIKEMKETTKEMVQTSKDSGIKVNIKIQMGKKGMQTSTKADIKFIINNIPFITITQTADTLEKEVQFNKITDYTDITDKLQSGEI